MINMSFKRIVMLIVEAIGVFKGAINCDAILNEVGVALFILGAVTLMMVILVTLFPECKEEEDC